VGSTTIHTQQLFNGALLVVIALAMCVRDAVYDLRPAPQIRTKGSAWSHSRSDASGWGRGGSHGCCRSCFCRLPGVRGRCSFLFGGVGARQFLPALGAFFVFGLLAGLVPTLDWPLRAMAARYAGGLLVTMARP